MSEREGARRSGHYPYQVCFGVFDPRAEDFARRRVIHQLPFAHVMLGGLFEDDAGGVTTFMRTIESHSSAFTMVFDRRAGADFGGFHPESRTMFRGSGAYREDGAGAHFYSMNEDGLLGVDVKVSPGRIEMIEPGARIAVSGERTGLGFNFFAPQANDDIYRAMIAYDVSGEIFGRKVRGFLTWQPVYAMPGEHFGYARIVPKVIYAMAMGVNRYDDGTVEVVHASAGRSGWGYLSASVGGAVTFSARNVECDVELEDDDYPRSVRFRSEAGDWIWENTPGNRFAPARQIPVPYRYGVGVLRRADERRTLLSNSLTGLEANPKTWRASRGVDH